jgi:integrase
MHLVPMATQAVGILRELQPLTGHSSWVFPGVRTKGEPMSENTVNATLRRLGDDRSMITAHGFRGMASTLLHECGRPFTPTQAWQCNCQQATLHERPLVAASLPTARLAAGTETSSRQRSAL